jgi:PAS domain S-box-containing protein
MASSCPLGILQSIHLVVEASPDAKIVINDQGEIIVFNQKAEFLFGYERSEVLGKKIETLLPDGLHEIHFIFQRAGNS